MALTLDASSPAIVATTGASTVTTASFTPPNNSLLLVLINGNNGTGNSPGAATATDNLGVHLTYNLIQHSARGSGTPATEGWSTTRYANVVTGAAMTVSATNVDPATGLILKVMVFTDSSGALPSIGTSGKSAQTSGSTITASYTASVTGSRGVINVGDWDALATMTAGTGCTTTGGGAAINSGQTGYAFILRSTADGTSGSTTTMNVSNTGGSTNIRWTYVEVCPAASSTIKFVNGAEGQASGTTATTANTGGASGDAFYSVGGSGSGTFTFDNTFSGAHGSMAYKVLMPASPSSTSSAAWKTTSVSPTTVYARAYLYLDSIPINTVRLFQWQHGPTFPVNSGFVTINTSGQLALLDNVSTVVATMTTVIPTGQWVRIEGYLTSSPSAGILEAKLFSSLDNVTATDTVTATNVATTGGVIDFAVIGNSLFTTNVTYWIDDIGISSAGYLGPVTGGGTGIGTAYDPVVTSNVANAPAQAALGTGSAKDVVGFSSPTRNNFSDDAVPNMLGETLTEAGTALYCAPPNVPFGYPTPPFALRIDPYTPRHEVVLVTGGTGVFEDPWVVQRGYQGSQVVLHNPGAVLLHQIGAVDILGIIDALITVGRGHPEGAVAAGIGAMFVRLDGDTGATLYVKETGGSSTAGWAAVHAPRNPHRLR